MIKKGPGYHTKETLSNRWKFEYHLRMRFNAWCYDRDNWITKHIDSKLKAAYLWVRLLIYDLGKQLGEVE